MAQTQLRTEQIVPGDYPHYIQEPYDGGFNAMTAALLHFNSNFTDETGNIWTPASACATGTAGIDTGVSKFGGGSCYLKENPSDQGDYITTPIASKYNLGSNDFAIEFWINRSRVTTTGNGLILGVNDYTYTFYDASAGRTGWSLYSITDIVKFAINGYEFIGGNPFNPGDNNWHHIAVCRQGNLFSSYYDGVRNATGTSSNPVLDASGTVLQFGNGSGGAFYGEICGNYDELRLTVGSCIYSGTSFSLSENLTEEFYKDVAIIGVTTESTNTDGNIPRWTVTGTQLDNGLGFVTSIGITGSNSNIPSEKAVRDAVATGTATAIGTSEAYALGLFNAIPSQTGSFLTLTDTPDSYAGKANYYVQVADNETGLVFSTGSASAGGSVATDTIWDAVGDLAVGNGANSAARLGAGTNGQFLAVNTGTAAGLEWETGARVLIAEKTPSGTGSVSFLNIPGNFKNLCLELAFRSTQAATSVIGSIQFNADATDSNYYYEERYAYQATGGTNFGANRYYTTGITANNSPAGEFSMGWIRIFRYTDTNMNKHARFIGSHKRDVSSLFLILYDADTNWKNTVAITQIDLLLSAGNYAAGSAVRLYGEY